MPSKPGGPHLSFELPPSGSHSRLALQAEQRNVNLAVMRGSGLRRMLGVGELLPGCYTGRRDRARPRPAHRPPSQSLTEPKPPTCVVAQVKGLTGTAAERLLTKHRWRVGTVNHAKANARAAASDLDPTARQTQDQHVRRDRRRAAEPFSASAGTEPRWVEPDSSRGDRPRPFRFPARRPSPHCRARSRSRLVASVRDGTYRVPGEWPGGIAPPGSLRIG